MLKMLSLTVALLLHLTGMWSLAPQTLRQAIIKDGSSPNLAYTPPQPPALPPMPVQTGSSPLTLTSPSVYALDDATNTVLYSQNADTKRPIASITKLVTTMVVLADHAPSDIVTIPKLPSYQSDDELIGLVPGEQYTVADLVEAALIQSADDSADALAIWDAGSESSFIAKMNAKMHQWQIPDTHFASASGLQDEGNYSTAASVARIAQLAMINPLVSRIVAMPTAQITSSQGRIITLSSIDQLLATGKFYGIKTGYTGAAGECFVGLTRINGHSVITVVLGGTDRFGDTLSLTNWIQSNYSWQ